MVKKGAVEQLGEEAQHLAIKYQVEGLSAANIASKLNEQFDADLTEGEIRSYGLRSKNQIFSVAKEQKNFSLNLMKDYYNTIDQINNLTSELWEFFYEIKKTPELKDKIIKCTKCGRRMVFQAQSYDLLLKTAREIRDTIKHVDVVTGRLRDKGGLTINYNMVDMSKKINNVIPMLFHQAERQGDIKIIKKKKYKLIS